MSEEIKNEATAQESVSTNGSEAKTEASAEVQQNNVEKTSLTEELVNPMTGEVISPAKSREKSSNSPYKSFKPETFINPMTGEEEQTSLGSQVIIKKDRGLAYYVGFALLFVLSLAFFFMPGITITFAVSRLVDLNTSAAWVFSTILSFGVWLIFKLKIKGFEKSFHYYLVLCVICLVALLAIQFITNKNIISEVIALLIGAKA